MCVGATPSKDLISSNSGLFFVIAIALAVSITDPPPTATIKSAPAALNAANPSLQFLTVGFCFISVNTEYAILASSNTFFILSNTQ